VSGGGSGVLFVIGVFVGSVAWQLVLGLGGAYLGPHLGPGLRRGTSMAGYGLVVAMAVALAVSAFGP
jgi:arginine exporter protein ArgO